MNANNNRNRNRNRNDTRTTANDRNIIRNTSEMDDFDNNFDNLENGARESEHENEEKNNNNVNNNNNSNNNNRNNVNVNVNVDGSHSSTSSRVSSQVRQTHHHNEAPSVVVDTMAAVPRTRHTHSHRNRGEQQLIDSGNISTTDRRGPGRSGIRTARLSRGGSGGNSRFSKIPKQKILTGLLILAVIAQFVFFYIMVFAGSSQNDNTGGASSSLGVAGSAPGMSNQMEDILGAGRMAKLNLKNKILPN